MKSRIFGFLLLLLCQQSALAHGGHDSDPHHLHRQVQATEVTLQLHSSANYLNQAKQKKWSVSKLTKSPQVVQVILAKSSRWLNTKVKLKITDSQGKSISPASGIEPLVVSEKSGVHYAFPVNLKAKQKYFVMIQFLENNTIQRVGFELIV